MSISCLFRLLVVVFHFPQPPGDGLNPFVFPIPALLAQKKLVTLGPWFLGSLMKRLDECYHNIVRSVERYGVICYVEVNFLQLFL